MAPGFVREPLNYIARAPIRRKHWIENVLNFAVLDNQREALEERHPARVKRRQVHRSGEFQVLVRQYHERQMHTFRCFALISGVLSRETE